MPRDKNTKLITFEVDKDTHKNYKKLVKKLPHISTLSHLIRRSLLDFEKNLDGSNYVVKGKSSNSEIIDILKEISKKIDDNNTHLSGNMNIIMSHLQISKSSEVQNYIDKITETLFVEKQQKLLKIKMPGQLIPLLKFKHHSDYLNDWLAQQEQREYLHFSKGKIVWNEKKIREYYHD